MIKALYDYNAPTDPPHYLSFSAGDFLHVVSRENDPDWYEACNPLIGSRGLVPVKYFQEVGKTVRDSADSSKSASATHDSGYAENAQQARGMNMNGSVSNMNTRTSTSNGYQQDAFQSMPPQRASKSINKSGGVYGVVSYDFTAERPDELDAKAGEAIIVIAQSNPEWFVAKPITRLGGPGLIPVSFISIRDMTTGAAVNDAAAAIAKAGIPKVEDWKRMAAEYKNTSIPLGQVSMRDQQNMQQSMERLSVKDEQQQQPSQFQAQAQPQQNQQLQPQQPQFMNGQSHQRTPSGYRYQQQQEQNLYAPVRASVPRFTFADDKFHFVVECKLSNGTHWDLSRIYEDFYELQINLINAFPDEAGQTGRQRTLPYMPGPVKFVTDNISEGRRANLDEYLRDLLKMPAHITSSSLVRNFFHPRDGDYEVDPGAVDLNEHARPSGLQQRQSSYSQSTFSSPPQQTPLNGYAQEPASSVTNLQQYTSSQMSNSPYGTPQLQSEHARSPSQFTVQSASQSTSQGPLHTSNTSISGPTSTAPVKVKAWFDRDTCVVIRMPARGQFTFDELYRKISERRRLEFKGQLGDESDQLDIEYRDEKDGEYYRLEGDEDLDIAVERNEKLTLAVRAARA